MLLATVQIKLDDVFKKLKIGQNTEKLKQNMTRKYQNISQCTADRDQYSTQCCTDRKFT